jgi:hypothetical protein
MFASVAQPNVMTRSQESIVNKQSDSTNLSKPLHHTAQLQAQNANDRYAPTASDSVG